MYTIKLEDSVVQAALGRLADGMDDLSGPMAEIGEVLVQSSKQRIDQGISPDGTPFAPRSQTTLANYARAPIVVPQGGPLKLRGDMQSNIFAQSGVDHVEVGSNAIQSGVMQFGAEQGAFGASIGKDSKGRDHFHSIPWGDIPARPFLGISEDDRTNVVAIVDEWIGKLAEGGAE